MTCRSRNYHIHHSFGISGSRTYLDTIRTKPVNNIHYARNRKRIILKCIKQNLLKTFIALLYVSFTKITAKIPTEFILYMINRKQSTDFFYFSQPHMRTRFRGRNGQPHRFKTIHKGCYRSKASVIDRSTSPIHNNTFNLFHIIIYLSFVQKRQ